MGEQGSTIALVFLCILILTKGAEVFVHGFDYKSFIVQYIGIPVYLILIFGYKFGSGSKRVSAISADTVTGVPEESIASERARYFAKRAEDEKAAGNLGLMARLYRKSISWLF